MAKSDKELAVELTCAYLHEFAKTASTNRFRGDLYSRERIFKLVEIVEYLTEKLSRIKDS